MEKPFLDFSSEETFGILEQLRADRKPLWGQMSAQHMVEHLTLLLKTSSGRIKMKLMLPDEKLPGYHTFLLSGKPFPKLFRSPALPAEPIPLKFASLGEAIEKLKAAVAEFHDYYAYDPAKTEIHPTFGPLNYREWIIFHNKHFTHHFAQFGLVEE